MRVPITWLQQYIEVPADPKLLSEKFTYIGYMLDRPPEDINADVVLDLEVRQNRSDCLSVIGLARELGAVMNLPLKKPDIDMSLLEGAESKDKTEIHIENPDQCFRFNTVHIEGLKHAEGPDWMKKQLESYGITSKNALVDITNYVMVEYGQPLHAFDADKLDSHELTIRQAKKDEQITLLGDRKVSLVEDDLVIANSGKAVAIAGVMGGQEKEIDDNTTSIILEAATYNQANIRRSTLRHDVRTEASTRLEKFLHPELTEVALVRAIQLIQDIIGGKLVDHTDAYPNKAKPKTIELNPQAIERLGGISIPTDESVNTLNRLEIETELKSDMIVCTIPYFRTDIEQEADIVEEVIRIHGYDKIVSSPLAGDAPQDIQSLSYTNNERIRDIMVALGYDEQITEPLANEEEPKMEPVLLENSLTSEKTMLRTTLQHSLAYTLINRKKYGADRIKLFEVGKVYSKNDGYNEEDELGGIVYDKNGLDYFDVKGDVEALLQKLGYQFDDALVSFIHDDSTTLFFSIRIRDIVEKGSKLKDSVLTAPPQLIKEDFSFAVKNETPVGKILKDIRNLDKLIYSVKLGEKPHMVDDSTKKILISVAFHSPDLTLSTKDVEPIREKILNFVKDTYQ